MSQHAHEAAVQQDSLAQPIRERIAALTSKTCPFCGEKELYVHPPRDGRNWWVLGCQSRSCDSSWRTEQDGYHKLLSMVTGADEAVRALRAAMLPDMASGGALKLAADDIDTALKQSVATAEWAIERGANKEALDAHIARSKKALRGLTLLLKRLPQ
jgi:hypothetical protein